MGKWSVVGWSIGRCVGSGWSMDLIKPVYKMAVLNWQSTMHFPLYRR